MNGWQPIDTAPKDGTVVLLWNGEHTIGFWAVSPKPYKFEGWSTGWETSGGYDVGHNGVYCATHWMRLPPRPRA